VASSYHETKKKLQKRNPSFSGVRKEVTDNYEGKSKYPSFTSPKEFDKYVSGKGKGQAKAIEEYFGPGSLKRLKQGRSSKVPINMEGGGMMRDKRDGMAMVGRTRVPRVDDSKVLMEAGGYSGGLAETGRGTMAGEMGRKGSMSVREAGEDMFELSKRKRGMQGGGPASSYNRRYNNQNK